MRRQVFIIALAAGVLGSCGAKNTQSSQNETSVKQTTEQPIKAHGNEPFWSLHIIDANKAIWERPDTGQDTLTILSYVHKGTTWTLKARKADIQLQATFSRRTCSDGMSDLIYPFSVEVAIFEGRYHRVAERYTGCGE